MRRLAIRWAACLLIVLLMGEANLATPPAAERAEAPVSVDHPFPPANHFNGLSILACANTHPSPPALSSWYIQYSNPYYYDMYHIRYTCIGHYHPGGADILCVWTGVYWAGGAITGPYMGSNDCTFF